MPKRPNPMAINKALSYTIEEAACGLRVTPATIRNYVRRGLPVMASQRPYLILGEALREFLLHERQHRKRPLRSDELFCAACGKGRKPFALLVDLVPQTSSTGLLKGLCAVCDGPSRRMIALRQLPRFAVTFDITEQAGSDA